MDMVEEDNPSNIEWEQKKGESGKTHLSRRIDLQKAVTEEAKDRNNFKATAKQIKNLSPNLKRLKTKIRDVYDDEDEDEEETEIVFNFDISLEAENSSLMSALKDDEKSKLQVNKTLENQKMQQTAGKMEAIIMADKMSKQLGLKSIKRKIVNNNIQDVAPVSETFDNTIKQNITAKTKLKTNGLSAKDTANMVKGLRKVHQASLLSDKKQEHVLKNTSMEDLVKLGRSNDDKKNAEIILEKSGRKERKKLSKKEKKLQQKKLQNTIKKINVRD